MTRRNVIVALVVVMSALGGWAWAQTRVQGPPPPVLGGGPFAVSPVGQSAILLDTSSGKTWELTRSVDGQVVWLPGKRIDSEKEAEDWREREKKVRQQLEQQRGIQEQKDERKQLDKEDVERLSTQPIGKEKGTDSRPEKEKDTAPVHDLEPRKKGTDKN